VDTNYLYDLNRAFNWSGDSKWIAFEKFLVRGRKVQLKLKGFGFSRLVARRQA